MEKVYSIRITPYQIIDKSLDSVLMISNEGNHRMLGDSSVLMKDFNLGDYLFEGRMVGNGFVRYNYTKMNDKERKKYFPDTNSAEPKDLLTDPKYDSFFKPLK